ncbi:uncharacterized protein ACA1_339350 [Acanthamoeba castellanii str. Neff]|uniref:Uncharacterized protein n=1 Tax=Acanthamoeba castellanii (strain ATCC 30010 / Neff) TaxID=1257118 RepID=L8HBU4_ACACF|nr:uncharacterized protein ACA1_339350 [Acanthamoeba castellanii str. Neff]ELR22712.1 hypothetical protein ACA1_339350 [Acanthamoeba castellanii str. Neff]
MQASEIYVGLRQGRNKASLDVYAPQANFLALMMTSDRQAIGSYHGMAYTSSLAWKLKDKIDQSFMQLFYVAHMGPSPVARAPEWDDKHAAWQRSQRPCAAKKAKTNAKAKATDAASADMVRHVDDDNEGEIEAARRQIQERERMPEDEVVGDDAGACAVVHVPYL